MAVVTGLRWPFVGRRVELERIEDALADPQCTAVWITGVSGVGKSRLAAEALEVARDRGHACVHVLASANASAVPLSALLPIIPAGVAAADPQRLFEAVAAQVSARVAGGDSARLVVAVDDIDLLDVTSLALLAYLLANSPVFVIATQRDQTPAPDMLAALWRGGRALRLSLGLLQRLGVETLLHLALGAPVTAPAAQALWDASRGNLLHLRELVSCARSDGTLTATHGVWQLARRLSTARGVRELVDERLARLGGGERAILDLLALCQPIGLDDLLGAAAVEVLTQLEREGLVVVDQDRRRQEVSLAHPLHAQVLQESMPRLAKRALLLSQVERVRGHGARRGGDTLLLASWLLDATGAGDPDLLVRAAGLALFGHDLERTRQLAQAALAYGPHTRASLLLGTALGELGRGSEALEVLRTAFAAAPDEDVAPVAQAVAINLYYGAGDLEGALQCLRAAAGRSTERSPALDAAQATYLSMSGRTGEAMALLDAAGTEPTEPTVRVHHLRARARVLLDSGHARDAAAVAERAYQEHLVTDERSTLYHPAGSRLVLAAALHEQGQLASAAAVAEQGLQEAVSAEATSLTTWFPGQLGRTALACGRPVTAARYFLEAVTQARATGDPTPELLAQAGLVLARTALGAAPGEVEPAHERMRELQQRLPLRHADIDRANAWSLLAHRGVSAARAVLLSAAQEYLAGGHLTHALTLLHDAVRLGDPGALEPLVQAAAAMQGSYARVRADHARAVLARDPQGLLAAADAFAGLGAQLLAAEASLSAAELWRAAGEQRRATAALGRARDLAGVCEGALPAGRLDWQGSAVQLSAREREVSLLAVRGLSSRQIAEQLFLSARTVDNHLQNVYTKLGIAGRGELAAHLAAPTTGEAAPR